MALKLFIFNPNRADQAPIHHEFSKSLNLQGHIQKLCSLFGITDDYLQFCLQVDVTKQFLTDQDIKNKSLHGLPAGAKILLVKSPKYHAMDFIEKLRSLEPDKTKPVLFELFKKGHLTDVIFLQNFVAADGMEAIWEVLKVTTGNTMCYAMSAFSMALTSGGGWNLVTQDLIEFFFAHCFISRDPINVITAALRVLIVVAGNASFPFTLIHGAALATAQKSETRAWSTIVDLLDDARPQQLKNNALDLLTEAMKNAGSVSQETQTEFFLMLQQLGLTAKLRDFVKTYPQMAEESKRSLYKLQRIRFDLLSAESNESYEKGNAAHEQLLTLLWTTANPGEKLEGLVHDQWKQLGFQQKDPTSDFRGMGLLGLKHLVYFATAYTSTFRRMFLEQASRKTNYYPTAVAGINISQMLFQIFEVKKSLPEGNLFPIVFDHDFGFEELYCLVFQLFDRVWDEMAADYMDFTQVNNAIKSRCEEALAETVTLQSFRERNNLETLMPNPLKFPPARLFEMAALPGLAASSGPLVSSSSSLAQPSSPSGSPAMLREHSTGSIPDRQTAASSASYRATAPPGHFKPMELDALRSSGGAPSSSEDPLTGSISLTVYVQPTNETKTMLFEKSLSVKQVMEQIQTCSKKKIKSKKKGEKFGIYLPLGAVWFEDQRKLWSFLLAANDRIEFKPRVSNPGDKVVRVEISTGMSSYQQRIEFTSQTTVKGVLQAIDKQQSIVGEIGAFGIFMKGKAEGAAEVFLDLRRSLSSYGVQDQDLLEFKRKPEGLVIIEKIIVTISSSVSPTVIKQEFDTVSTGADVMGRVARKLCLAKHSEFGLYYPSKDVWIGTTATLGLAGVQAGEKLEFKPRPDNVGPLGTLMEVPKSGEASEPSASAALSLSAPPSIQLDDPGFASPPVSHASPPPRGGFGALAAQAASRAAAQPPRSSCPVGAIRPLRDSDLSTSNSESNIGSRSPVIRRVIQPPPTATLPPPTATLPPPHALVQSSPPTLPPVPPLTRQQAVISPSTSPRATNSSQPSPMPALSTPPAAAIPAEEIAVVATSSSDSSASSHGPVQNWSVEQVAEWLRGIGYPQHCEAFVTNLIDGEALVELTPEDLKNSLKIPALGARKEIMRQIAAEKAKTEA